MLNPSDNKADLARLVAWANVLQMERLRRTIARSANQGRKLAAAAQTTQGKKVATVGAIVFGALLVAAIGVFV